MVDVVIARPLQPVEVDEYVPMEECEDEWVPEPGDDEEEDEFYSGGYNPGTNPGTTNPPSGNTNAPLAKQILTGNLSAAQWANVERMIEKIRGNCMGLALYNTIVNNSDRIELTIDPSLTVGGQFARNYGLDAIQLQNDSSDDVLFHEMVHYLQTENRRVNSARLNCELEAWLAHCRYLLDRGWGTPEFDSFMKSPIGSTVFGLESYLASNGLFAPYASLSYFQRDIDRSITQFRLSSEYGNEQRFPYNQSITGMDNFKTIIQLSTKCQ